MRTRLWNPTRIPAPSSWLSLRTSESMAAGFHTSSVRPKLICNPTEECNGGHLGYAANDWANFGGFRKTPGMIYWDKSMFIPKLEKLPRSLLFCRPRGFGKSYNISMLKHFHGLEFRYQYDELFKGLSVDKAVRHRKVAPGRYLVLSLDLSTVLVEQDDIDATRGSIIGCLHNSVSGFVSRYHQYLDLPSVDPNHSAENPSFALYGLIREVNRQLSSIHQNRHKNLDNPLLNVKGIYVLIDEFDSFANGYMDPRNTVGLAEDYAREVLISFLTAVSWGFTHEYGVKRVFMTGVTPLSLRGRTKGFKIARNVSYLPSLSDFCGLTRSEVAEALEVFCNNKRKRWQLLDELAYHANGYLFGRDKDTSPVFNTETTIDYLDAILGHDPSKISALPNSEVSEKFLSVCTRTPGAVEQITLALRTHGDGYQSIPYRRLVDRLILTDLHTRATGAGNISAWHSLQICQGGLTFDANDPENRLKIPNRIAGLRFGKALLLQLGLFNSMNAAADNLNSAGDLKHFLSGYCAILQEDVDSRAFDYSEEYHRDRLLATLLENQAIETTAEYEVTKEIGDKEYLGLRIKTNNFLVIVELKVIKVDNLDLRAASSSKKAAKLASMDLDEILKLKISKSDGFHPGKSIKKYVNEVVAPQLEGFVLSDTVETERANKEVRAFAVVIIGNRQVLVREMDGDGNWKTNGSSEDWISKDGFCLVQAVEPA